MLSFTIRQGCRLIAAASLALGVQAASAATWDAPVGVQLYTLRNSGSTAEQLAAVQRAGISYVETAGNLGATGTEARDLLSSYGLSAISAHVSLGELRTNMDGVIAYNKALGNDTIVLPWLPTMPSDAAGWAALGKELAGFAETLDRQGMRFAYHNHAAEMTLFNGVTAFEILLDAAGPLVKAQLDLAWAHIGGMDPVDMLNRLSGRLISVHAKDAATGPGPTVGGSGNVLFAAVGEGVLDWDRILPAAHAAGVEWYVIEHDFPPDAENVITIGNNFLRSELEGIVNQPAPVPLPAGLPLLACGLLAFGVMRRRAA